MLAGSASRLLVAHQRAVDVFEELARNDEREFLRNCLESSAGYVRLHHDIIVRFGRFPHHNAVLERESTPNEQTYRDKGAPTFDQ